MISLCYTLFAVGNKQYKTIIDAGQAFCKMHHNEMKEVYMGEEEKAEKKI